MNVIRILLAPVAILVATVALLPLVVIVLPFLLAAHVTRMAATRLRREPPSARWHEFVQYEPVIGWRPRPNLDLYGQADGVFHLTTGPDGWRGQVSVTEADIVVFGDSFAFGHGAADENMYTEFCGELRVKPIGSDAYDMVPGVLWMERLAPDLAGKLVVWFVYYGNDLWDNLQPNTGRYRKPFVRRLDPGGDWEIVTDHVSPEPWPFPSSSNNNARLADLCCPSPVAERTFAACDYLIRRAETACRRAGAQLAVVGVPVRAQLTKRGRDQLADLAPEGLAFDAGRPDKKFQESCQRLGIPFVPLSAHLNARHYLFQDAHWKTSGHKRVGAVLRRLHEELGS